jgi:hypothetical protein
MSHLMSWALRQWLCPGPVSLSLAATATAATASLVPSLQLSPAAALPSALLAARGGRAMLPPRPAMGPTVTIRCRCCPAMKRGARLPDVTRRRGPTWRGRMLLAAHSAGAAEPRCRPASTRCRCVLQQGPVFAVRYRRCAALSPPCRSRRRMQRQLPCPARRRPCPCQVQRSCSCLASLSQEARLQSCPCLETIGESLPIQARKADEVEFLYSNLIEQQS